MQTNIQLLGSTPPEIEYHTPRDMQYQMSQAAETTRHGYTIAGLETAITVPQQVYAFPTYMSNRAVHETNSAGHLDATNADCRVQLALRADDLAILQALHSPASRVNWEQSLAIIRENYRAESLSATQEIRGLGMCGVYIPQPIHSIKQGEVPANPVELFGHKMSE